MSQPISPLQSSLARLIGQDNSTDKTQKPSDPLTGILRAKQQADAHALGLQKQPDDKRSKPDAFQPSAQGIQAAAMRRQLEQSYGVSQTMSLSLTTKEGDQVQVDFKQLYAQYQSFKQEQAAALGPQGVRQFQSTEQLNASAFEEKFAFSVKGDLNEDELKAIYDVFEQVDELANQFFDGNIEEAFKQAQQMDIDFGQLQNVSLDLQKTEVKSTKMQQAAAYQGVQQATLPNAEVSEERGAKVSDLPPYLQKWQQAVETMDKFFEEARKKVDELFSGVLAQRDEANGENATPQGGWYERVKSFHDQLAEMAKLDKVTLKPSGVEVPTQIEPKTEESEQLAQNNAQDITQSAVTKSTEEA